MRRNREQNALSSRKAITLIEVIAATAIAGVMLIPLAGLIRSTRVSVEHVQNRSDELERRDAVAWINAKLRLLAATETVQIQPDQARLTIQDGATVVGEFRRSATRLVYVSGGQEITLVEPIAGVQFDWRTAIMPLESLPTTTVNKEVSVRLLITPHASTGSTAIETFDLILPRSHWSDVL
ncbi:MAG: hypothetical protein AAF664_19775 [Planctomycetota bacterium]